MRWRLLQSDWLWQDSGRANRNLARVPRPFLLFSLPFRPPINHHAPWRVWLRETRLIRSGARICRVKFISCNDCWMSGRCTSRLSSWFHSSTVCRAFPRYCISSTCWNKKRMWCSTSAPLFLSHTYVHSNNNAQNNEFGCVSVLSMCVVWTRSWDHSRLYPIDLFRLICHVISM